MRTRSFFIVFSLLLVCISCHAPTREAKRMIARAERLADTLPDSTVCLIDSVLRMPVYFSERQRMDMALLQAEALFDNHGNAISPIMDDDFFDDCADISASPELEHVAAFYANKKQYAKAAKAALYSGFVQQHYNEKEAAMLSFKDAERYGGLVGDSLTVAQARYKMGRMLFSDGMKEKAVILLQAADKGFDNHFSEKALVENMLAVCYMVQGDYENTEPADTELCRGVEAPSSILVAIDSLMWRQPDSALMRLLPYFDTCTSTGYNSHYANLLLAELLYKNDFAQTNRVELLQAVAYFDSLLVDDADTRGTSLRPRLRKDAWRAFAKNSTFLDARAHYINGVGYYENDSLVEACKEYMKALEVMENHFVEKELVGNKAKFMALTYTRLTVLYSNSYLQEQAICFGKASVNYYKLETSSWHLAWLLDEIGSLFEMMSQLDSADYYYQRAATTFSDTSILIYRDILTHQTLLKYKMEGCPDVSILELRQIVSLAQDKRESLARCLVLGEVFYNERQLDSAWYYLNKVFKESSSVGSKKQAAEWLIEICKIQGRDDGILEYAEFLVPFANQEENQSAIKTQLTELYKSFSQNRLERLHQQETKKNQKWIVAIMGWLLAVMLTIAFFLHKNRKRKEHLEVKIKEEQYAHDIQQKALSGRLKRSNETLREALKRIEEQKVESDFLEIKEESNVSGQQRYEAFMQTPICKEVFDRVEQLRADKRKTLKTDMSVADYKSFALSATQMASLSKVAEEHFPELFASLKKLYPAMSQKDWKFCLLQLDKMTICVLLQESYHTCRRYTMKLEQFFRCQQGLSIFLLEHIYSL